jgi:hypothetical protein
MNKRAFAVVLALVLAGCGSSNSTSDAGGDPGSDAGTGDGGTLADGGTACTTSAQCGSGNYCSGTGCGESGSCAALPTSCPPEVSQVCGCDGMAYSNACKAFEAGTRVFANGACQSAQCTGIFNMMDQVVDAAQSCSINSDCQIDRTPNGIGPCWAAVNKTNEAQLQSLEGEYATDNCGNGVVGNCGFLPSGAICDGGSCTAK